MGQHMNRKDFLEYLAQWGLSINSYKLRRYVGFGLIHPVKRSLGKGHGVITEYTTEMAEALKDVEGLQSNLYIEHDREFVFVLFAKGYTVNYNKLKEYYIENFYLLLESYKYAAVTYQQDQYAFMYEFVQPLVEKHLPKRKPGKPSTEDDARYKEAQRRETARALISFTLWSGFADGLTVPKELLERSAEQLGISSEQTGGLETLETHFQRSIWEAAIRTATCQDFKDIQNIFQVAQRFLDVAVEIGFEHVPILGWRIQMSKERLEGMRFLESPKLVRLVTVLLLRPEWRNKVKEVLYSEKIWCFGRRCCKILRHL